MKKRLKMTKSTSKKCLGQHLKNDLIEKVVQISPKLCFFCMYVYSSSSSELIYVYFICNYLVAMAIKCLVQFSPKLDFSLMKSYFRFFEELNLCKK